MPSRLTMLPASLIEPLKAQIAFVQKQHTRDLANGYGSVELPFALERKYPNADKELAWQYVFPSERLSTDPRSRITRRHHLDPSGLLRALKAARNYRKSISQSAHILSVTALPPTCWRQVTISARCRNCSGTRMSKPP